ncbi:type IX secretion system membrane protein PorP/SprF [Flavobacteriaceae bacterium TP-CH-4]|uniref:Type IX secretion system membrane protein PorP/SprF n=1 Tax=Pelagihabitans pacificus TaxID=2696054 RepID=A0A967AQI0_9FLAO|nr:type IX secretion system membrane protein PorP/SprF [Pelagihabitans pacificus]NHF58329.1 type IX secretion system membrane protein PorP/SprF [Pelagihabitans pacificus]
MIKSMAYHINRFRCSYISLLVFLLWGSFLLAQNEPQYTQYMYNIGSFNPAYVGTTETPEITTMYRAQWLSIPGAPRTIRLGTNIPFANERMGLGVNVINEQLGPLSQTYIDVAYSYQFNVSENTKLSFGMDVGGSLLNVDFTKGTFENPGEPILDRETINNFYPTIGAGMFLYQDSWYLGLSIPNFLTDGIYNQEVATVVEDKMQYNFIGGYVFDLSETTRLKPAFLVNYIAGAPVNVNISANFLFNDRFTVGASYRVDNAVSALAGFQISNPLFFGVSYDYSTNGLGAYNDGTPEFVLKFYLGRTGQRVKGSKSKSIKGKPKQIDTPRFF